MSQIYQLNICDGPLASATKEARRTMWWCGMVAAVTTNVSPVVLCQAECLAYFQDLLSQEGAATPPAYQDAATLADAVVAWGDESGLEGRPWWLLKTLLTVASANAEMMARMGTVEWDSGSDPVAMLVAASPAACQVAEAAKAFVKVAAQLDRYEWSDCTCADRVEVDLRYTPGRIAIHFVDESHTEETQTIVKTIVVDSMANLLDLSEVIEKIAIKAAEDLKRAERREAGERAEYERLKAKYEGGGGRG